MVEKYWRLFVDIKIAEDYYRQYLCSSARCTKIINGVGMIVSFTGAVSFVSEFFPPLPSACIVVIAQIVTALQPYYPFGERVYAARCIHKELSDLALTAEQTMNRYLFADFLEKDFPAAYESLQQQFSIAESTFATADLFPQNNRFHKKAEKNVTQYLKIHFKTEG